MSGPSMKVVRLHAPGDLRLHEEPVPKAAAGEILLRVSAVGICGSDLHWFAEGAIGEARLAEPVVLGHEFSAATPDGRRVAVDPSIPCEECEHCREGNPNLCEKVVFAGYGKQDGALRQYLAWPERVCFPIPDQLSDADGVMLEPLGVAIHAVDLAHLRHEMRVAVLGCGPIGLLVLQLVRLFGVKSVLATEVLPHRLEAARALGFEDCRLVDKHAVALAGVDPPHVVFECAGENAAVETAVNILRPGGKILLAGIPPDDRTAFRASVARRKGITFMLVRRMKHTYPRAIELVEQGLVDVRSLVTHRFPLEKAAEAFAAAVKRDGIKVIIEMPPPGT
ncbi:MAG: alcohol dehydrogenase catalytic domain-containing protein [Anaerolineales bacterium]|nr:alcohol dehydrogenase catalytic domain-containing protein [Anaerolineales bacterium]